MYQEIREPINVTVAFKDGKASPLSFNWGGRDYAVNRVNMTHVERRGREKVYVFSVSDKANAYRLKFSTETLKWDLEEMAAM